MTLTLLRPKALSVKNSLRKGALLGRLPFMLAGLIFAVLLYLGSLKVIGYVRGIEVIGEALSRKLLSMVFFSLSGFLLLSNIITAISSFYLSRDIPFLLTLPVKREDILSLKSLETFANSSWMTASFLPPVFLAYGVSYGAPMGFYVVAIFALISFMVLASALGIISAHLLARLFPAKGMRDVLLFLSLLIFLAVYFILGSGPNGGAGPEELLGRLMSFSPESPLLPNYWASEMVYGSLSKGLRVGLLYPTALFSSAFFFWMLSLAIGSALYAACLERMRPGAEQKTRSGFYPGKKGALLYKDAKTFLRDASQWSQLVVIGALLLVYVYNFRAVPLEEVSRITPLIGELIALVNMVMAGLVMSAVAARFVYSSVSLEGQAFWAIRSAPVTMRRFLVAKFFHGFWPLCAVTMTLVFLTNLVTETAGPLMYVSLGTVALLSFSISGLGTGLGALYPKFRHENIASVSMSAGGLAFMSMAFALVLLTVALAAWPFYVYHNRGSLGIGQAALPAAMALAVNIAAFYLPMRMGIKKLANLEE